MRGTAANHHPVSQIAFIDETLPDLRTLLRGLPAGTETHLLSPHRPGLEQIADALGHHHGIQALHLFTHGAPGKLFLGSTVLDRQRLTDSAEAIESIVQAMAPAGELLIYGCEVAAGNEGQAFVETWLAMSGLKVAAARHKVGHPELGGSWALDWQAGTLFQAIQVPAWQGVLSLSKAGTISPYSAGYGIAALDSSGSPYVLFNNSGAAYGDLYVYKWNGSAFTSVGIAQPSTTTISGSDVTGTIGEANPYGYDIQVAADGTLFVGATTTTGNVRKLGVWKYDSGGSWTYSFGAISGQPTNVLQQDMEMDAGKNLYFAYTAGSSNYVGRFATSDGGTTYTWEAIGGLIPNTYSGGGNPDLELATDGTKYIAYIATDGTLAVSKFDGTNWVSVGSGAISTGQIAGNAPDLEIAPDGTPYVLFKDAGNTVANAVTVKKFDGTNWVSVGGDGITPNAPMYARLALDETGKPYVAYTDGSYKSTVISYDGSAWVNLGSTPYTSYYPEITVGNGKIWLISQQGAAAPYRLEAWNLANNVPTLSTLTTLSGATEDTGQTISFADLQAASNAADSDGTVTAFEVQAVTTGTLTINGSAYNASTNKTIDATKSAVWTPAANAAGSALNAFTVKAKDNGGAVSATAIQVKVDVTAVNDAPTLADTALALGGVAINAATPTGAVGTLVSTLVGGITDPDSGAVKGVAISATDTSHGSWYYSTDGGATWSGIGAVTDTSALLLASDANTRVYFKPATDYAGTVTNGLTLRAWDQTSGVAGGKVDTSTNGGATAFSTATDTVSVTVAPALTYSGATFSEASANDGSISNSLTLTLAGDTFAADVVTASKVSATNVPAGLTASFTRTSDTVITLSLTGNAAAHANANDIGNLSVAFQNGAFTTNGTASQVLNYSKSDIAVDFFSSKLAYSATTFVEAGANDGSITTVATLTLSGADTFTGINGADWSSLVSNVPAGLTASLIRTNATTATLSLTGNATAHANANDVANLTVSFDNAKFSGGSAAAVTGATTNNLLIDFADPAPAADPAPVKAPGVSTVIDGANVTTSTTTTADGRVLDVMTVAPVAADHQDQTGDATRADVALYYGDSVQNVPVTYASLPTGVGLTATGARTPANNAEALQNLIALVDQAAGTTETNRTNMETGSQDFLNRLEQQASQGPLIINSVKLSVAPGQTTAPDKPITIAGSASSAVGTPIEAIVIDARSLPAGTVLELKNVEFAVILGDNVTVRGGDGSNIVFAGSGSQNIVLGPEDDELHGGSGDDFVGSEGGNDRLFGEAGNDTLRGGADNDYLDGGSDTDTALYAGNLADYQISQLADGRWRVADQRTGTGNEGVDILKDMELAKFADQTISIGANYDLDHDAIPDFLESASGTSSNAKDNDVFGNSKLFVRQLYRDILFREAEDGGLKYWQSQIDNGTASKAQITAQFLESVEFQTGSASLTRLYLGALNRLPDGTGMNSWMGALQTGTSLASVAASFVASSEFASRYGSLDSGAFIDQIYQNIMGRVADSAGKAYWLQKLEAGASKGDLLLGFTESAEYTVATSAKVAMTQNYLGLLDRSPEQGGIDYWLAQLASGTPQVDIIGNFLSTQEYHNRFLP